MSGRQLDPDGTDSYHPEHPWESAGHPLYIEPTQRTSLNWPPEPAYPVGPHEAKQWDRLPVRAQYGLPVRPDTGDSQTPADDPRVARAVAETVQKVYLGVGPVLTRREAREIARQAGAAINPDELIQEGQ